MVVAIEDVSVRNGVRRAVHFVRSTFREIAGIFGVVLLLAVIATIASIVATAGLGLINLIPILGLAVLPLQIAAWLVRGFVFQYLALAALGAYLTHYRHYAARHLAADEMPIGPGRRGDSRGNGSHDELRQISLPRRRADAGVGDPPDGHGARAEARHHLVRARLSGGRHLPVVRVPGDRARAPRRRRSERAAVRTDARLPAAARGHCRNHGASAARPPCSERLLVTTGSQQGLDLVARVLVDPGDVVLVELPTYTGAITAFRNVQAQMVGVPQEADGIDLEALDDVFEDLVAPGPARALPLRRAELPESDRTADWPRQAPGAARVGRAPRHADRRGRPVPRAVLRRLGDANRTCARSRRTTSSSASSI